MNDDIQQALAPLVGQPLRAMQRALDMLWLHFGGRAEPSDHRGPPETESELSLHVACPWRMIDAERVLVGSGDLFTPADPDGEPETFDWEPEGASWLDIRLAELAARHEAASPVVEAVSADRFGGVRILLRGALVIELFPSSTPTGHVATEFWRLTRAGGDEPNFVVGTFGIEREPRV